MCRFGYTFVLHLFFHLHGVTYCSTIVVCVVSSFCLRSIDRLLTSRIICAGCTCCPIIIVLRLSIYCVVAGISGSILIISGVVLSISVVITIVRRLSVNSLIIRVSLLLTIFVRVSEMTVFIQISIIPTACSASFVFIPVNCTSPVFVKSSNVWNIAMIIVVPIIISRIM